MTQPLPADVARCHGLKLKPVVGETLWYTSDFCSHREVMVSKVGSRWIYFDGREMRCDFDGYVDDDYGRCYQNEAAYVADYKLGYAWKKFRADIAGTYMMPRGITVERIKHARAWLFGGAQ